MYSTCLFCHTNLGANEAVEHFQVGRRLAFDAAKGRLWVVCRKCERWNLTPVEERWEAIEECERSFRATRLRTSTDQIGLARLSEGLELVRIGKPLRPEFAAWRYGDQFGRRRRNKFIKIGAAVAGVATIPFLGPSFGLSIGAAGYLFQASNFGFTMYQRHHVVARVRDNDGNALQVRSLEVNAAALIAPSRNREWGLRITHRDPAHHWWRRVKDGGTTDFHGEAAMRAAGQLLPLVNKAGASAQEVQDAVTMLTRYDNAAAAFERTAKMGENHPAWNDWGKGALLSLIPAEMRLGLEMASHEESERRALEGELSVLEDAWREAEEIAAISDDMFLPTEVSQKLGEIKSRVSKDRETKA
ncbi:MAG: hypothetical protein ABI469_08085 [Gemmatimonadales bacterium]